MTNRLLWNLYHSQFIMHKLLFKTARIIHFLSPLRKGHEVLLQNTTEKDPFGLVTVI